MNHWLSAFRNSGNGIAAAWRTELAVRAEIVALVLSVPVSLLIVDDGWTRIALIGAVLVVLMVELLNTALEKLCDHVTPENHPEIGLVKDLASAAVLASLLIAALVWGAALWRFFTGG